MNELSFGQYYNTNSWLHRLNPLIKIIFLILSIVSLFILPINTNIVNLCVLGGFFLLALILIISAKIPLLSVLKTIAPIIFLVFFTAIIQILSNNNGTLLATFDFHIAYYTIIFFVSLLIIYFIVSRYIKLKTLLFVFIFVCAFIFQYYVSTNSFFDYTINVYTDAIFRSLFLIVRVIVVILLSSLLTHTTSILALNKGMKDLLTPLRLIKIKTDDIAMMMSLVIRFIPTLLIETNKIIKAQSARGADFLHSRLFKKIKILVSLLIPIFIVSIKKAEEMADAMSVRGYELGKRRSSIDYYKTGVAEFIVLFLVLGVLVSMITLRILGYFSL